ncbi:hypothetical protein UCRPA7_7858 [Phaeoacremonium minimum UCRPA7]|uniref:Uncharacterized protein n=1 Tax=Phaeoacremonium minimum (strain UCR-PA7) TaxID=1286976 RepID=R8BBM1_PHAM7|nr:hypothetical protein UCRPA7_7858 [Phaeoacremonium minimum UCRPA7]EON96682.1 hypothetical protein UCRPA7_7858 [Phaeoacremonium minimum UCRPA7]
MASTSPFERFSKWLKLKIYQTELNFSVYMYTPWEKFVFWSITFLLFSLTTIAAILYLPQHIIFIVTRAWFYINGENVDVVEVAKEAVETLVHHHGSVSSSTAVAAAKETVAGVLREL